MKSAKKIAGGIIVFVLFITEIFGYKISTLFTENFLAFPTSKFTLESALINVASHNCKYYNCVEAQRLADERGKLFLNSLGKTIKDPNELLASERLMVDIKKFFIAKYTATEVKDPGTIKNFENPAYTDVEDMKKAGIKYFIKLKSDYAVMVPIKQFSTLADITDNLDDKYSIRINSDLEVFSVEIGTVYYRTKCAFTEQQAIDEGKLYTVKELLDKDGKLFKELLNSRLDYCKNDFEQKMVKRFK